MRAIRLRQQKTEALLDVPVHPVLRNHLDAPQAVAVEPDNHQLPRPPGAVFGFNDRFRRIATAAGVDAQARDLRRTAMLRMAEAGATVPQIASVSGHSIETTQRILETYLPRNFELAENAITRLADYQKQAQTGHQNANGVLTRSTEI